MPPSCRICSISHLEIFGRAVEFRPFFRLLPKKWAKHRIKPKLFDSLISLASQGEECLVYKDALVLEGYHRVGSAIVTGEAPWTLYESVFPIAFAMQMAPESDRIGCLCSRDPYYSGRRYCVYPKGGRDLEPGFYHNENELVLIRVGSLHRGCFNG